MGDLAVRIVKSLATVAPEHWDACVRPRGDAESLSERFNPFVSHAFLAALELSGSATPRSGWAPMHLVVEDRAGALLACAPCYLKSHSYGEYVFDHAFADALERAGGRYYPKLQVAVPFTPVTGPRLLVAPGERAPEARAALVEGLESLRATTGASSIHATFVPEEEQDFLATRGFLPRKDQQFHFLNEGFSTFEDFLGALASRKRKMIRRERVQALAGGLTIERLAGREITEAHWDAFFGFYMDTGSRKWGRPYLTRDFFTRIGATMVERVLLVMARRRGRPIAGALNFIGDDALYGRNWGAIEHHPFLHFELCYYQAIEFAIQRGLKRVEAGAQGEHKLARGYRARATFSAHSFADPRLRRAVADYLVAERAHVDRAISVYDEMAPFRQKVETE